MLLLKHCVRLSAVDPPPRREAAKSWQLVSVGNTWPCLVGPSWTMNVVFVAFVFALTARALLMEPLSWSHGIDEALLAHAQPLR